MPSGPDPELGPPSPDYLRALADDFREYASLVADRLNEAALLIEQHQEEARWFAYYAVPR